MSLTRCFKLRDTSMKSRWIGIFFVSIFLLETTPTALAQWSSAYFGAFDRDFPGRGQDVNRPTVSDHPMAYALYASAAINAGQLADGLKAIEWLLQDIGSAKRGWGLKFEWDAFGDGTVNPPETVYGIETAFAVRALLDAYEATKSRRYADAAESALDYFSSFFTPTPAGGFFWYSDQAWDAKQVANVSAMLAGQYARTGLLLGISRHSQLASAAIRQLMTEHLVDSTGAFYWRITDRSSEANDALHAAYVVSGLLTFRQYGALPSLDTEKAVAHLVGFLGPDEFVREMNPAATNRSDIDSLPARAGAVGQISGVLAEGGFLETAEQFASRIHKYEFSPSSVGIRPGDRRFIPRVQAQLVDGLSRLDRVKTNEKKRHIDLTFELKLPSDQGESLGTIFQIANGEGRCAAGFVSAFSSRIPTNQNDLEFWCEDLTAPSLLSFSNIGRSRPNNFTSNIAAIDGKLYDYVGRQFFDRAAWRERPLNHARSFLSGAEFPINVQRRGDRTYVFSIYRKGCDGISLYSDEGYIGTFNGSSWANFSAVFTDGSTIVLNVGHQVLAGSLGLAQRDVVSSCKTLPLQRVSIDAESHWVYAIGSFNGDIIYGGTSPTDFSRCASLYRLDKSRKRSAALPLFGCKAPLITEIYALVKWRNEMLIGNFPYGGLYAMAPDGNTRITQFASPRPDDLIHPKTGDPYRESQSVAVSRGRVLIGMYPWAELFTYRDEYSAPAITRIIREPEKGREYVPFAGAMAVISKQTGREETERAWGQRITSIAVLDGVLCVGTGNRSGNAPEVNPHPIAENVLELYGSIYCARTFGQTMTSITQRQALVRFVVTSTELSIYIDGHRRSSHKHNLSAYALEALSTGIADEGSGDYGPFLGQLRRVK